MKVSSTRLLFFFFNDTATTEIYTLSLHDALPILLVPERECEHPPELAREVFPTGDMTVEQSRHRDGIQHALSRECRCRERLDRKSTRLNSSHANISYAVFCLKKKETPYNTTAGLR